MKEMTIREHIQNLNVLLDTVYKYALENPNSEERLNVIDYELRGARGILKDITGINSVRADYKTRILSICNGKIILKFKMKKVKHERTRFNYDTESLSVISVELFEGEQYIDMTSSEFLKVSKEQDNQAKQEKANQAQIDCDEFKSKLEAFNMTLEQFEQLQSDYKYMSYDARALLEK